jgi:hypothetical protein
MQRPIAARLYYLIRYPKIKKRCLKIKQRFCFLYSYKGIKLFSL